MEQASIILQIIASTAIALAGFSGVVVALTGKSTESFNQQERINLRVLLQVSAIALFFSMVPLVLNEAFDSDSAWKYSMLAYGLVHIFDTLYFMSMQRKSEKMSKVHIVSLVAGTLIAFSQITIGFFGSTLLIKVSYLFVLIWHLGIAGMGFANLFFGAQNKKQS